MFKNSVAQLSIGISLGGLQQIGGQQQEQPITRIQYGLRSRHLLLLSFSCQLFESAHANAFVHAMHDARNNGGPSKDVLERRKVREIGVIIKKHNVR
jgi:hypothetical protein